MPHTTKNAPATRTSKPAKATKTAPKAKSRAKVQKPATLDRSALDDMPGWDEGAAAILADSLVVDSDTGEDARDFERAEDDGWPAGSM